MAVQLLDLFYDILLNRLQATYFLKHIIHIKRIIVETLL